jgi:hypothetical protein
MADWNDLLVEPVEAKGSDDLTGWFDRIAERLLNGTRLWVGTEPHRFTEIEFYYYGDQHLDVFAHRDPVQKATGRWYFHRTRGVYRGGSFKGVDLTFGGADAYGGVLIRGIEAEGGPQVDGPSLTVDRMLARTEAPDVASLDTAIDGRLGWDGDSPLRIEMTEMQERPLLRTARVGLTLKRLKQAEGPMRYIMRPYRYLSEPRRIAKGKIHMVLALHAQGKGAGEITEACGCPRGTVQRYVEDFEAGRQEADFGPFWGIDLGPRDLCKLHGVWHAKFGKGPTKGAGMLF